MKTEWKRSQVRVAEWSSYLLVLLVFGGSTLFSTDRLMGDGVDLFGTVWFYWWVKYCLYNGLDPSFTDIFFHPYGKDIFAHTGNNLLDAYLSIPFQLLFPFPTYFNVYVMVLLLCNCIAFRWMARIILPSPLLAWSATILWMVNPFVIGELTMGRPTQCIFFFAFLAIGTFWRLHRRPSAKLALLLGGWTALQGWIYWYSGYFLAFVLFWMSWFLFPKAANICTSKKLFQYYAMSVLCCLLLISPAVFGMVTKMNQGLVPGLGLETESWLQLPELNNNIDSWLRGYHLTEPFGHPMLLSWLWGPLLVGVAVFGRERKIWLGATVVTLMFATGAVWPIGGYEIPMPQYLVLYHLLPFFDRLWFPYRLLGFTFACLSVAAGLLLGRIGSQKWIVAMVLVGAAIGLLEHRSLHTMPIQSRAGKPPDVLEFIRQEGGGVIDLPIGYVRPSIMWQAIHEEPTFGGMGENARIFLPKAHLKRLNNSFIRYLSKVSFDPDTTAAYSFKDRERIEEQGFRFVLLDREILEMELLLMGKDQGDRSTLVFDIQRELNRRFGEPAAANGAYVLWDMAAAQSTRVSNQFEYTWSKSSITKYEQELQKRNRLPK